MEVSFVPQGTSDNVKGHFGCHSLGVGVGRVAVGIWHVEDRDVTKYPTNAQDGPLQQRVSWSTMSVVPRLRNHNVE